MSHAASSVVGQLVSVVDGHSADDTAAKPPVACFPTGGVQLATRGQFTGFFRANEFNRLTCICSQSVGVLTAYYEHMDSVCRVVSLAALIFLGTAACQQDIVENVQGVETSALTVGNGLSHINGLSLTNGLAASNGLALTNGLSSTNGLSATNGLVTSADGRDTIAYLVKCALPAGHSISKTYSGTSYTFAGEMGLAPTWENGACDTTCQEKVSSCMMALVNTSGVHVPLWLTAPMPEIGWGQNASYPDLEGAFFGNIFVPDSTGTVPAFYCEGSTQLGLVPGRIGANQVGSPYRNPWGVGGVCGDIGHCSTAQAPMTNGKYDGYSSCATYKNVITVWRSPNYVPVFDSNLKYSIANINSGKAIDWDDAVGGNTTIQQWTSSSNLNQLWRFVANGDATYSIASAMSPTKCLALPTGQSGAGTAVQLGICSGATNQSWTVRTTNGTMTSAYGQYFKFTNQSSPTESYLEVPGASTTNGARLDVAPFKPTSNQVWSLSVVP